MIPANNGFLSQDFVIAEQTTHTYRMDFNKLNIRGFTDGQAAMVQVIYKILNTERYQYPIYSWNYGVEFRDLLGEPISYVLPEIRRRVEEALSVDNRIINVDNFEFSVGRGTVNTTFTAHTIYGDFTFERAVNI